MRVLFGPFEVTADKVRALGDALSRHPSLAQIETVDAILSRIAATAKANGQRIIEASADRIAAAGGPRA